MLRQMRAVLICFALLSLTSCAYPIRYDGPYSGRVIDADTREPIEGVVVLGTWSIFHNNLAGGSHTFYDARETVTDKKGEFSIPGMGLRVSSNLDPMDVLIFKSGYSYIGSTSWDALKISSYYREMIKWEGDRVILPLKKVTFEERKKMGLPSRPNAPINKMRMLTDEINKARLTCGLDSL